MSWLLFTLSPIVGATVAYFDPALGVQVTAAGLCAGAGAVAIESALSARVAPASVRVRTSPPARGLVAPAATR